MTPHAKNLATKIRPKQKWARRTSSCWFPTHFSAPRSDAGKGGGARRSFLRNSPVRPSWRGGGPPSGLAAMRPKLNNSPGWILIDSFLAPGSECKGRGSVSEKNFRRKIFQRFYPLTMTRARRHFSAKIQPRELCAFHQPELSSSRDEDPLRWISAKSFNGHHLPFNMCLFRSKIVFERFSSPGEEMDAWNQTKKIGPFPGQKSCQFSWFLLYLIIPKYRPQEKTVSRLITLRPKTEKKSLQSKTPRCMI